MAKLIRFPAELEQELDTIAKKERRSFTGQVLLMIERQLEQERKARETGK